MTSVPASFADRQEDKYLELWARDSGGGRLTVDFGVLSEDLSLDGGPPNGKENTEDTKGNNEPDARLDLGLDTLPDHDEVLRVPDTATGQWVTLDSAALADSGYPGRAKDPALDNWAKYDRDNLENRDRYTRLQGNGGVLNSEDYSQDGFVSADHERGFRAVIDFDSMHAALSRHNGDVEQLSDSEAARLFVQKGTNRNPRTGWYLFRVPIHADSTLLKTVQAARAPAPTLREIKTVRLVWSGWKEDSTLAAEKQLLLTDIQFVGNQWQEVPRRSADSTLPAKIQALSINNIDDTAYLNDVDPLVRSHALDVNWQKDSHNDWKREQALRLPFSGLLPGEDALVDRRFNYQAWDLSSYHELSLLVHSDQDQTAKGVYFVFRFGTDSATYYEYRSDLLRQGWNGPGNKLTIRLKDLADLKLAYLNAYGDTVTRINTMGGNGHYRIYSAGGKLPTFSSITWMALGVVRDSSGGTDSAQGELWVDEMKVTGVHELSGWAARASFTTKWADFMDFSMTGEYTDGDFRTMTEDLLRPGATTLRTTMDASLRLDKFLPAEWGVSIPLGAMASGTLTRPQQKPGTDIALTNSQNQSDQLGDMFADAMANMLRETPVKGVADHRTTPSEHYQAAQLTRSWYTKYEKAAKSKNLATKLLAERISLSYNYRYDFSSTARGEKPTGGDYVDSNRTETYTGTLKYDLSPRQPPAWTRWKPFDKTKSPWLPLPFKNYELTFLPSTLRFDLLDVNYTRGDVYTAKIDKLDLLRKLNVTHGFAFNWEPVRPLLGMGYSLSIVRGLDDALVGRDGNLGERWWPVISDDLFAMHRDEGWSSRGLLNGEESRTQKVSLDFKPQFFDWLTHEFHYGADYGERVVGWPSDSTRDYCNLTVGTQFGFKSAFEFVSFLQGMADRTKRFKGLSTLFSAAGKGLDKIGLRSVSFDYNARSDLLNNYVGTDYLGGSQQYMWDFLLYQIGAKGRTLGDLMSGDMNDGTAAGGMRYRAPYDVPGRYSGDQRSVSQDFALATSLRMPDPVNISIDPIKLSWDRHYMVKPDPLYYDTTVTWPKVAVGVSTPLLGKIGALKKLLESLTLNSQYSYERSVGIKGLASVSTDDSGRTIRARPTPDTTEHNAWEPLVKVDGRLKKLPISAHFEWRFSTDTRVSTSWSHTRKNSQELGIDYELQKSLKERAIKIFRWSIPIRGKFTAGVALKRSDETSYQGGGSDSSRVTNRAAMKDAQYRVKETTSYSLIPKLGYVFTDNVDAELSYEGSKDDVQPENRKIYSNVGKLIVRIKF
jgi:hypothetical protein